MTIENNIIAADATIAQDFVKTIINANSQDVMKAAGASRVSIFMVPPAALTIMENFNVRVKNAEYHAAVREIADSIKANGFYPNKPFAVIVMKENGQDVIAVYDGHTRYDALMLAISEGYLVEKVPAVVTKSTLEEITVGLVTNNSGRQLDPMGIAIVCKRLIGYGLDNSEISRRLGFTPGYVGNMLSLIGAPKQIRDMVTDGKLSASLAVNTLRDHGEKAIEVLENGLQIATEQGKDKITPKNIPAVQKRARATAPRVAPVAPTAPVAPRKATPLELGLAWLNSNVAGESHYELMSAMLGFTVEELKNMVDTKE